MLNFAWLAQMSTSGTPTFKGLLPSLKTLITLLAVSAAIAGGMWLWTGLWAGALASTTTLIPFLEQAFLGVVGAVFINFWFNREINTAVLSTREVRDNFVFDKDKNPIDLRQMVKHLTEEVNAHFRPLYGKKSDIVIPRLCTFTEPTSSFKIITAEGRNPGKAAIFFSSGVFKSDMTGMNQRHLAALIQAELVKIYLRRGIARTFIGMGTDLATTLSNLNSGNWFARVLGFLLAPLQFFLLLERSVQRSHEYEAAAIVAKCGRGVDLIEAIDKKVCPTLDDMPTTQELRVNQAKYKRAPYNGPLKWLIKPLADWVDNNEYAGDDKTGSRIVSFFDIWVREATYIFREWFLSSQPRATNLKIFLRPLIKGKDGSREISLDTANSNQIPIIRQNDIRINQALYKNVRKNHRYAAIAPNGNGMVPVKNKGPVQGDEVDNPLQRRGRVLRQFQHRRPNQQPQIVADDTIGARVHHRARGVS